MSLYIGGDTTPLVGASLLAKAVERATQKYLSRPKVLEEAQRIDVVAHQQVFRLLIVIEHHLVRLTPHAGLLVPAKRGMRRIQVVAIGSHATRLDRAAHAVGAVDVAGPQAGAEAELGVVGDGQCFGFVLETDH